MIQNLLKTIGPKFARRVYSSASRAVVTPEITPYPDTRITTLPSAFRVVSESTYLPTATIGVWIDAGSRYEDGTNNGVAHFLEHMAFKGTKKRTQMDLELEIENMGAHLNAYTSREQTVYYAKCLSQDLERAVEMLSDILLNSIYGQGEIERERGVILREMEEINQNMQEVVFDFLHAGAYEGCSLSRTILGPVENIRSLKREHLVNYIRKYYKGPRMVLAAAGGVQHEDLVKLAQKYFGNIEIGAKGVLDYEPGVFKQSAQLFENEQMEMVYGCLTVEGTSWTHSDNIPMQVLNTLFGQFDRAQAVGISGHSVLAEALGPHQSGVESFLSFTTSYKDTGLTGLYFVAEPNSLGHLANGVCSLWQNVCTFEDTEALEYAKRSLITNSLLILDGTTQICEDIGRQMLCYGRRMNVEEVEERISSVNVDTIRRIGRDYYTNKPFAYTVIGKTKEWPTADRIQKWLSRP